MPPVHSTDSALCHAFLCRAHRLISRLALVTGIFLSISAVFCTAAHAQPAAASPDFRAAAALDYTRRAVAFGERPSGSEAIGKLRAWIVSDLKSSGAAVTLDSFTAETPGGPTPIVNIIAKFPGA